MKGILAIGGRLALICAAAAIILGLVNALTAPRIAELKEQKLQAGLQAVAPPGNVGEAVKTGEKKGVTAYYPVTQGGSVDAYVLELLGDGYAGDLKILAGYFADGRINAVVLMENTETPGLGKEAEKPGYMDKFTGTGGGVPVPARKSQLKQADADGVSGATVTFMGVARALENGSAFVRGLED